MYNGLMMTLSFFVFRIVFYSYMIFGMILPFCVDPQITFKDTKEMGISYFLIVAYIGMYGLNCFWFYKIMLGCLKALGIIKKSDKKKTLNTNKVE